MTTAAPAPPTPPPTETPLAPPLEGFEAALARAVRGRRFDPDVLAAALHGGKRMRPLIVVECFRAAGGSDDGWLAAGVAVELVHSASLAHDDLPAFDADDERRGRPTLHRRFDEPTAILAGSALIGVAFSALGRAWPNAAVGRAAAELGRAIDVMCWGQREELSSVGRRRSNFAKTASLLIASARLGVLAAQGDAADDRLLGRLSRLAARLGAAYQCADDLADGDAAPNAADELRRHLDGVRRERRRTPTLGPALPALAERLAGAAAIRGAE